MCTLSWIITDQHYEIFFNRDEQRTRDSAIAPFFQPEYDSLFPLDPQGGGTWIAINSYGVIFCLLNNYQAEQKQPTQTMHSRGLIIPQLLNKKIPDIHAFFSADSLSKYQAFTLFVFPPDLTEEEILCFQWDGKNCNQHKPTQPFTSSAVCLTDVTQRRHQSYSSIVTDDNNRQQHLRYHASHLPEPGAHSVCMHREDAKTQSLSHILVSDEIEFRYHSDSPCKNKLWQSTKMSRKSLS